jgi:DNA-binding NarL/FixJ family response regulator
LPDLTFQDLGEHGLKDLDRPEQIYQLLVPDLPRLFPPLRTVARSTSERLGLSDRALEPADALPVAKRALRVVVADDSVLLREGLSRLLAEAGLDVLASAPDADELLRQIRRVQPDVALTDIKMPPTHVDEGLVAATEIRRLHPKVGVLVLSHYLDSDYAMRLLEEYPERVGYLLKDRVYDVAVLADAIRRIAEGECVVDPTIVARLMTHTRAVGPLAALSAHQRALFELAAQGRSDDAIARQLRPCAPSNEACPFLTSPTRTRLGLFAASPRATRRSRRQREVRTGFAQDCQRLLGKVDAQGIPGLVDLDHAAVDENAESPEDAARAREFPELAHADEWNPAAHGDSVGTSTALN